MEKQLQKAKETNKLLEEHNLELIQEIDLKSEDSQFPDLSLKFASQAQTCLFPNCDGTGSNDLNAIRHFSQFF